MPTETLCRDDTRRKIEPPTGAEILRFRKRNGLWQRELADHLGVSLRAVQGWEVGERVPPPYLRLALEKLGERR